MIIKDIWNILCYFVGNLILTGFTFGLIEVKSKEKIEVFEKNNDKLLDEIYDDSF